MGMYTELVMGCELKKDTPAEVIETLKYMLGDNEYLATVPVNKLFATDRWKVMLCCDSYYFDGDTHSTLRHDDINQGYHLTIRCNLKNYCGEIGKFLNWIYPYADTREFVGYYRYEECEVPTLVYFTDKGVEFDL